MNLLVCFCIGKTETCVLYLPLTRRRLLQGMAQLSHFLSIDICNEVMYCLLYNFNCQLPLFFFIRTSNFDAEAERFYIFWRFEAETFLKMFLNLPYYYYYLP